MNLFVSGKPRIPECSRHLAHVSPLFVLWPRYGVPPVGEDKLFPVFSFFFVRQLDAKVANCLIFVLKYRIEKVKRGLAYIDSAIYVTDTIVYRFVCFPPTTTTKKCVSTFCFG